jgi:hypothetical protein
LISTRPSLSVDNAKAARDFKLGMQCPDHQLPIHSFTERPYSLLCDECLEEITELGLQVQPFNEAVQHTRENIERAAEHLRLKLSRLQGTRMQIETIAGAENHGQLDALQKHLTGFKELLDSEHRSSLEALSKQHASLSYIQSSVEREILGQEEAVLALQDKARMLSTLDLFTLVSRHVEVTQLLELSRKQSAPIEVSDDSVKVSVSPIPLEAFKQLIGGSVQLSLEAESSAVWKCGECLAEVLEGTVLCPTCRSFRPLSSYPHLLSDPMTASAVEISELAERRDLELAMISDLDSSGGAQGMWYIINADWVSEWKSFIFNKPSHVRDQNSINQAVGVLPPGPITNHKLFRDPQNPVDLRPKLKPVAHYRGVNEAVWQAYHRLYGGGPVICRQRLNIYNEPGLTSDRATV